MGVFERMEMTFIETLKVYLWPYYTPSDSTIENVEFESGSYKTTTEMTFRQGTPSLDLKIVMPTQKVFFRNVRIAYPFSLFFPLTAVRSNVRLGLGSGPVQAYESCKIQNNHMYKFIGKTIRIPSDSNSTYVLAADFSSFHRFIVKGRYVMGQWIAEITLKKNIIQIQKRGPRDIQVRINGQPVEFSRSNGWTVMAKDIMISLTLPRSSTHQWEVGNLFGSGLQGSFSKKSIPTDKTLRLSHPPSSRASWAVSAETTKSQFVRLRPSLATASTPSQSWRLPPGSSRPGSSRHHTQLCPRPFFPSSRRKLKSAPRSLSSQLRLPRLTRHSLASAPY